MRRALILLSLSLALPVGAAACGDETKEWPSATGSSSAAMSSSGAGGGVDRTPNACAPGEPLPCYEGPPGTKGVGICRAGTRTCRADGRGYGACEGQALPVAEDCESPLDEDCDGLAPACAAATLWARVFDGAGEQLVLGVAADGAGNALLTGSFTQTIGLGALLTSAGDEDAFVAKLAPSGAPLWIKRFGGLDAQAGNAVAGGPAGEVVVAGQMSGTVDFGGGPRVSQGDADAFLLALDGAGQHLFSKRFGGDGYLYEVATAVAIDAAGRIAVTGVFDGTMSFDGVPITAGGFGDIFVAVFEKDATLRYAHGFGDDQFQTGTGVAFDAQGDLLLTGFFGGSVDFGQGPLTSAGGFDAFVAAFDPDGKPRFSRALGGAGDDAAIGVGSDPAGNTVAAGRYQDAVALGACALPAAPKTGTFVVKLDPLGEPLFCRGFPGGDQRVGGLAVDATGNMVLSGAFQGIVDFGKGPLTSGAGSALFVAKLGPNGDTLAGRALGDGLSQGQVYCRADGAGAMLLGGWFSGQLDFGKDVVLSGGDAGQAFAAKLAP